MKAFLDLVLPVRCAGCGEPSVLACRGCLAPLLEPPSLAWPRPSPPGLPTPFAVAPYEGSVRGMLLALKEDVVIGLQRPLGRALAGAVAAGLGDAMVAPVALVPVPSSAAARRQRGEDVVRRLAQVAAGELTRAGLTTVVVPALRHVRTVRDSAGLGAAERARNLAGAFAVRPRHVARLRQVTAVLVDDLITTGVTLAECAGALTAAGAPPQACATVAATQRHGRSAGWDNPGGSAQAAARALPSQEQVPAADGRDPAWTSS